MASPLLFPHVATLEQVYAYLKGTYHLPKEGEPIFFEAAETSWFHAGLWKIEQILLNDLERAKDAQDEQQNFLRGLIRAVSWRTYDHMTTTALKRSAHVFLNQSKIQTNSQETRIFAEIINVLEKNLTGSSAIPALNAIEGFVDRMWKRLEFYLEESKTSWEDLAQTLLTEPEKPLNTKKAKAKEINEVITTLKQLRPIRDQIYFQVLYPEWLTSSQIKANSK
ncbi:MAG TPA: hypothetical protein VFQ60_00770 [Patescibacteria group bacterium]|nr:hypothetical protein [Patescibacteria group bacterium]